jgi:hypothetical protein
MVAAAGEKYGAIIVNVVLVSIKTFATTSNTEYIFSQLAANIKSHWRLKISVSFVSRESVNRGSGGREIRCNHCQYVVLVSINLLRS